MALKIVAWEKIYISTTMICNVFDVRDERSEEKHAIDAKLKTIDSDLKEKQSLWSEALTNHDGLAERSKNRKPHWRDEAQYTEQNNHVSDLRVKVAAIQERRDNLQRSIAHHERSKTEFSVRKDGLAQQIIESQEETKVLTEEIEKLKQGIEEEKARRQELQQQIADLKTAYDADVVNVRDTEAVYRERRKGVDVALEDLHQVSMKRQETQIAMETLCDRILERYQIP